MTREHREDLVLAAIIVSIALHVGLMIFARTRVMTHVVGNGLETGRRREAMRVEDYTPLDPVRFEMIRDIMASKKAPEASVEDLPDPETGQIPDDLSKHWGGDVPAPRAPDADEVRRLTDEPARFEIDPLSVSDGESAVPKPSFDVFVPEGDIIAAPDSAGSDGPLVVASFGMADVPAMTVPQLGAGSDIFTSFGGSIDRESREPPEFVPSEEIYEEVDAKIVEAEKEAVRDLLEDTDARELDDRFVHVAATRADADGWTYFRILVTPRQSLDVVEKDVVILIDASGSIGAERLTSCRKAAKAILRSAFNSGDRFNLVAFRNKFSYAFRAWQPCDDDSFSKADKWLSKLAAHGRTEVFETISSVLTLPRDPARPLIALVVTDGDANVGVSDTTEILSKFTALNDGLISVYMYGVKEEANRELIDVLTRGNRGESFIYGGSRWSAGAKIESLSERFRDPVMSDLRVVFAHDSRAEAYPRRLRNLYRGDVVQLIGRVPAGTPEVAFSLKGLNGRTPYEGFFSIPLETAGADESVVADYASERAIDEKLEERR